MMAEKKKKRKNIEKKKLEKMKEIKDKALSQVRKRPHISKGEVNGKISEHFKDFFFFQWYYAQLGSAL